MAGDADVVFVDGKVFTASRERPWAKGLAVRGDRLLAVGSSTQAERWRGRRTRLVDLRGVAVVPGSSFYGDPVDGRRYVRFMFSKREETLREAISRLADLRDVP
ncbi:hypothetical protein AUG86_03415 [Euryarchaeota archaeon 13_1_20CM_4_64_14]|nr:MAG: hypothetical protein AUG86_03415 [Euryarchaeota archaeon 13_1_20CM_4_64_14]